MSSAPAPAAALRKDLETAGYYPDLVADVLDVALSDEPVVAHLVHPETTFDAAEVRRHVTVLVLTPTRLVVAHVDDHPADSEHPAPSASATTEAVPLHELRSVVLTHVIGDPVRHTPGTLPTELTLAIGWGEGSEMRRPLGITIIGDLLGSQILTLLTTPVVYMYLDRFRRRKSDQSHLARAGGPTPAPEPAE